MVHVHGSHTSPHAETVRLEEIFMQWTSPLLSGYIFTRINNSTPAAAPASPCKGCARHVVCVVPLFTFDPVVALVTLLPFLFFFVCLLSSFFWNHEFKKSCCFQLILNALYVAGRRYVLIHRKLSSAKLKQTYLFSHVRIVSFRSS